MLPGLTSSIPGRMAWASLKLGEPDYDPSSLHEYPGPHGLGLIEAPSINPANSPVRAGIPGRMAWASLKLTVQDRHDGLDLKYPGPHGLGLIEAWVYVFL